MPDVCQQKLHDQSIACWISRMENEILKRQLEALQRSDQNPEFEQTANEPLAYTQGVDPSFGVAESLSLFTGLNYDMGERSYGISRGLVGGELKSIETLQKSKKRVTDHEETKKICDHCGTVEAPEWRKGPNGPKTLCNACGLRWSKKQRTMT
ncbi:unnamed protein product [Rhizopus stolonifer]